MTHIIPNPLSCLNDNGQPVDWWFMYKVPSKSVVSDGSKALGTEYIYYDSSFLKDRKPVLSAHRIDDPQRGALSATLNQLINNVENEHLGWFFYNDEDAITGKTNSNRGHTKGVLAFDFHTDSAFWLIHSTPKFTVPHAYQYPDTAVGNGQTFLCISLKDAAEAKKIAAQMYIGQQPNVYAASAIPPDLLDTPNDPRFLLMRDQVHPGHEAYADSISFLSAGGKQFMAIAKNKHWNTENDDDFYNDLVSIKLNENLEVETWEHGVTPGSTDRNSNHKIVAAQSVNLQSLEISPSYYWSEENDHAKLAISEPSENIRYVCVGDLNFTIAQEKRSGGTVAFPCHALWESLWNMISPKPFDKKRKK